MNKRNSIYFSALILLFLVVFSMFTVQKQESSSGVENVSAQKAKELIEKGDVFVLDVRTPAEFNLSHIEGATLIPVSNAFGSNLSPGYLLKARINEVPKNKKILVYCKTGGRSVEASTLLLKAGYQVYNMKGGISSWTNAGYPVVSPETRETDYSSD